MRNKTMLIGVGVVIGLLLAASGIALAGSLNPTVGPGESGSQMYTLEQIYQRLTTGNYFTKQSGFTEPASGPGTGTMHTLDEIMAQAQPRALAKRVALTGQTTSYATGDDGYYQAGIFPDVAPTCCGTGNAYNTPAWTGVRFTDNGDGTVTDNLTALIWLKNAGCVGFRNWLTALASANALASGACGLSDGSIAGQWRLPNANELHSLGPTWPPGGPFTGVGSDYYWSSTTNASLTSNAWIVYLGDGGVSDSNKASTLLVWPVRGGQ